MLASCSGVSPTSAPAIQVPTAVKEESNSCDGDIHGPSLSEVLGPDAVISISTALGTPLPPTPPQATSLPVSMIPTTVVLENGLEWTQCVVPNRDYVRNTADLEFLAGCVDLPEWDENDEKRRGERVEAQPSLGDLRITIGSDHFETKLGDLSNGCCQYELIRNGEVILKITPGFMTHDPNRNFWNIGGKLVWELAGYTTVIVVDGVNYNEEYGLEGSFFPYEINGKLIYIARKDGRYHIVYDGQVMGPEFDEISMAYCCGMKSISYGQGQYWFIGRRAGTRFVVLIH